MYEFSNDIDQTKLNSFKQQAAVIIYIREIIPLSIDTHLLIDIEALSMHK